jgi:hypothetical protein
LPGFVERYAFPTDIVDGNLKLILGMIWTLILRFTIAEIAEGSATAKDGTVFFGVDPSRHSPAISAALL